jgi:hypothetical protein
MRLAPQSEVVPASPALRRLRGDVVRSEDLTSLSTDQVRPQERLDYWREMVLRMFADVEITSHVDQGFHGHMRTRFVDGVRFTVVDAASQGVARRHPEAREHYEDCYFAVLMLAGSQWLEQDGPTKVPLLAHLSGCGAARPGKAPREHRESFWRELV